VKNQPDADWGFLIAWQFKVRPGMETRFEVIYGPNGDWAMLFQQGEGYIRTELNRDLKESNRYLTLDFWTSAEAYERFRNTHAAKYKALDEECEALTESEVEVGKFIRVGR